MYGEDNDNSPTVPWWLVCLLVIYLFSVLNDNFHWFPNNGPSSGGSSCPYSGYNNCN
jgi:hypothetical protein